MYNRLTVSLEVEFNSTIIKDPFKPTLPRCKGKNFVLNVENYEIGQNNSSPPQNWS